MLKVKKKIILKYSFLLAFISGCLGSLGLAPYNFFGITILSLVFSIYLLENQENLKKAFYIGLFYGLGFYVSSLYWIAISFKVANMGGYLFGSLAVIILCFFLSLFSALTYYLIKRYSIENNIFFNSILIIFIFSIFDWIKGNILWGFPWTPISAIWSFNSKTLAPFSYMGIWGYSLLTYALVVSIYLLNKNLRLFIFFFIPFVIVFFISNVSNKNIENIFQDLEVRLVQPNISQSDKWDKTKTKSNLKKLLDLSKNYNSKSIDLVIWPETSILFDIQQSKEKILFSKEHFQNIENIIIGGIRREKIVNENSVYNSLFLIDGKNKSIEYHDKLKLVPFGEYIPFRKFLKNNKILLGGVDFSSGKKFNYLNLNNDLKILPLICYEVIFPKISKSQINNYDLIVNITNDAWFGNSRGPYQHLALSRIRAVLEGKFMLRVANTGISSIIDYDGKLIEKININKSGVINKNLVLFKKNTLYNNLGDSIFFILLAVMVLVLIVIKLKNGIKARYVR